MLFRELNPLGSFWKIFSLRVSQIVIGVCIVFSFDHLENMERQSEREALFNSFSSRLSLSRSPCLNERKGKCKN
jgi:hypothetical protein